MALVPWPPSQISWAHMNLFSSSEAFESDKDTGHRAQDKCPHSMTCWDTCLNYSISQGKSRCDHTGLSQMETQDPRVTQSVTSSSGRPQGAAGSTVTLPGTMPGFWALVSPHPHHSDDAHEGHGKHGRGSAGRRVSCDRKIQVQQLPGSPAMHQQVRPMCGSGEHKLYTAQVRGQRGEVRGQRRDQDRPCMLSLPIENQRSQCH